VRSLATADNAERYRDPAAGTLDDALGDAYNAIARLRQPGQWTLVIDNCNVEPAEIADLLPVPGDEQVVLVTTTNTAWISWASQQPSRPHGDPLWTTVDVGPLTDRESTKLGCPVALREVAGRRPLFARAFAAFSNATKDVVPADTPANVDTAAWTLWSLAASVIDASDQAVARAISWLQPDGVSLDTLQELVQAPSDAVTPVQAERVAATLERCGLVNRAGDGIRMHRLVAGAIRAATPDDEAATVVSSDVFLRDGEDRADKETIDNALSRLMAMDTNDAGLKARALWSLMTLMEPRNQVDRASEVAETIESLLRPRIDMGEPLAGTLADALHARARWVHQNPRSTREDCLDARGLVAEARSLREGLGDTVVVAKSDALDGLLLRRAARGLTGAEWIAALIDALGILEQSYSLRESALGAEHRDTARARFNLAGLYIQLAQADEPSKVGDHLQDAYTAYEAVLATRRRLYRADVHIHYAASIHGFALVSYYRAILTDVSDGERVVLLRDATSSALDGLRMRQALDASVDGADVQKSLELLAKILDARNALGRAMQFAAAARRRGKVVETAQTRQSASKGFSDDIGDRIDELVRSRLIDGMTVPAHLMLTVGP
jgi:hypothetical protein